MARKNRKKIKSHQPRSLLWGWAMRMDPAARIRAAGWTLRVLIVGSLCLMTVLGLRRLERYVHNLPQFKGSQVTLALANKPSWMDKDLAKQILHSSAKPVRSRLEQLRTDGQTQGMVTLVARQLAASPWVKQVTSVRQCYAGQLVTTCQFRQPKALVRRSDAVRLIDQDSVVLPGKYRWDDLAGCDLFEIKGLSSEPPADGRRWKSVRLDAALELVRILDDQSYRSQIEVIDVGNFAGRIDPLSSWIILVTDQGGTIHWGRPKGQEKGLENSADEKLALLAGMNRKYGRVDMNLTFVDIRRSPTMVDVPALISSYSDATSQ